LLVVGKLEVGFIENVRFNEAARHVCLSIAGRTIDAMMSY
jgi:hypothetical protein